MSSGNGGGPDDKFVHRDVGDLRVKAGEFAVEIRNLKENTVTKEQFANWRLESLRWTISLLVPILAAALGALAILFSGLVRVAVGN